MELGVSHEQSLSSLTPIVDNTFDKYNKNLVPIRSLSDHDNSILFSETGSHSTFSCSLTPTEELFLDKLLVALENMNSTLTHKFKRMKRYSILTWVLRWGVFSNA